jgi:hypothetical protein
MSIAARPRTVRLVAALAAATALVLVAAGCSTSTDNGNGGSTINVPDDQPTITKAVAAAKAGDLILVAPGTYKESVNVETDNLVIRGLDRNKVVLDGGFKLENGIRVTGANGVVVENMTAKNYTSNGFYWTGVKGYRGSYLTASRNGDYGIYAFDSYMGQFDHSFGSGSPDAGFYIGQCYKCDAVIDEVTSEYNGLGYSGTNSGGDLYIVNSIFRHNRAGIVPNSGSYELCYPERDTTVAGNLVHDNNEATTPAIDVALLAMGNGILTPGGIGNDIQKNRVFNHERTGIGLVPFPEEDANDNPPPDDQVNQTCDEQKKQTPPDPDSVDAVLWQPKNNKVTGNVVENSGLGDIAVGTIDAEPATLGNCFSDNTFGTSAPKNLETLAPCTGTGTGSWTDGELDLLNLIAAERPPSGDYKIQPVPGNQPNMPNAAKAGAKPMTSSPAKPDLAAIKVPAAPAAK